LFPRSLLCPSLFRLSHPHSSLGPRFSPVRCAPPPRPSPSAVTFVGRCLPSALLSTGCHSSCNSSSFMTFFHPVDLSGLPSTTSSTGCFLFFSCFLPLTPNVWVRLSVSAPALLQFSILVLFFVLAVPTLDVSPDTAARHSLLGRRLAPFYALRSRASGFFVFSPVLSLFLSLSCQESPCSPSLSLFVSRNDTCFCCPASPPPFPLVLPGCLCYCRRFSSTCSITCAPGLAPLGCLSTRVLAIRCSGSMVLCLRSPVFLRLSPSASGPVFSLSSLRASWSPLFAACPPAPPGFALLTRSSGLPSCFWVPACGPVMCP